ncbi:MAG: glycosyltransferase [Candidatus Parcubacteria bacterium]|nr:glycosyltransferase [Candidatus Parcubacteria bacterium]
MKIAIFSDTFFPRINGVANMVSLFAKSLAEAGQEVFVFTVSKLKNPPTGGGKNPAIINLPSIPTPVYTGERLTLPVGMALRSVKKIKPDIIHVHTPFTVGWEAILAAKIFKIPLVGTHHTFYDHYLKHVRLNYDWAKKLSWKYTVAFYNRCDLILNPSQSLTDTMIKKGLKKPADVLRNFIETDFFKPAADKQIKQKKSITYMGRLSYEKNIDQVIKAFALVLKARPNLNLTIIGDGPERKNLENLTGKLGIKNNIIFTGFLRNENLLLALQSNDIFVTASKSENMPLSVVEAMAVGLPCVAVKEKGLTELIKDGYNGFLVEADRPEKLAKKILDLLARPELLEKFSHASRELALEYSKEKIINKLINIYENLSLS